MNILYKRISINLASCRKAAHLSPEELAAKTNLSPSKILGIEAEKGELSISDLLKISEALGISITCLVDDPAFLAIPEDIRNWLLRDATVHDFEQLRVYIHAFPIE